MKLCVLLLLPTTLRRSSVNGFQSWFSLRRVALGRQWFCAFCMSCPCVCVCLFPVLSLPLSMLPAAAAQLNLSQRWVLMSFSSVGVARLARLDVHFCDRFSISLLSVSDGLKGFIRSSFCISRLISISVRMFVVILCLRCYYGKIRLTQSLPDGFLPPAECVGWCCVHCEEIRRESKTTIEWDKNSKEESVGNVM